MSDDKHPQRKIMKRKKKKRKVESRNAELDSFQNSKARPQGSSAVLPQHCSAGSHMKVQGSQFPG